MTCTCNDGSHELGTALWHRSYRNWYDHREAGNATRARLWGYIADRLVFMA